ncbi:MAG: hypothetical protein ACRDZW_01110 [Acidimicrobiales bacterium]
MSPAAGNTRTMIAFFVILVVLMVLAATAGSWSRGAGRRRDVVYRRAPADVVEVDVVEEVREVGYVEETVVRPRTRRVVRRRL